MPLIKLLLALPTARNKRSWLSRDTAMGVGKEILEEKEGALTEGGEGGRDLMSLFGLLLSS